MSISTPHQTTSPESVGATGRSPVPSPGLQDDWFKTETEAYAYVLAEGVTVSRGKFNQDKLAGKIRHYGRSLSRASVEKYINTFLKKNNQATAVNSADLDERRKKADTEKAESDARISLVKAIEAERDMDKNWLHRDDAYEQLAGIFGQLVSSLHRHLLGAVPALIHLCGGDPTRGPELYDGAEEVIIKACNDVVAGGRIEGIFTSGED